MQDKYTGLSGEYIFDHETGERMSKAEHDAPQAKKDFAVFEAKLAAELAESKLAKAPTPTPAPASIKKDTTNGTV